jgi:hypothetical protein
MRLLGVATLAMAAVLAAGCGSDDSPKTGQAPTPETAKPDPNAKPSKPYTVEELATKLGCKPVFQGKTKDFRQAACAVGGQNVVLAQFDKESGMQDWVEAATQYGGVYLVGERWVLSGRSVEYMRDVQKDLGGEIEGDKSG